MDTLTVFVLWLIVALVACVSCLTISIAMLSENMGLFMLSILGFLCAGFIALALDQFESI